MAAHRIKVPPAFVNDCLECDCDVGEYERGFLTCDDKQLAELVSRARHYANGGLDAAHSGLVLSARATLRALSKLEVSA